MWLIQFVQVAQRDAFVAAQNIDDLERNIAQAKAAALAHGTGVKSRLQNLEMRCGCQNPNKGHWLILLWFDSYRVQIDNVARLKEETIRAIIKNSHEIAMFKEEVSRHLTELRGVAEAEWVKRCFSCLYLFYCGFWQCKSKISEALSHCCTIITHYQTNLSSCSSTKNRKRVFPSMTAHGR